MTVLKKVFRYSPPATLLFFLAMGIFTSHQVWAASYFIENVKTTSSDPSVASSVRTLIESSVVSNGGSLTEHEAEADYTLRSDVIPLGSSYVVNINKVRKGAVVYSTRQKAPTAQDLDDATDRAVRSAMINTPTKKDLRVGDVPKEERDKMRSRVESKNTTYFGFGPAGFQNMGVTQLSYDLALGYNWGVNPHSDVKVLGDAVVSGDWKTSVLSVVLGLNYYFTDEDSTPYISGGIGFGASATTQSSATTIGGFDGEIGLGYQLFRTSSTQFDVLMNYTTIFGNNTIGAPGFYSIRFGVLF